MTKFEQQADERAGPAGRQGGSVVLVADHEVSPEVAADLARRYPQPLQFALIAPAVTRTHLQHAAGNADEARREAEQRLGDSEPPLREAGLDPEPAAVGDQDPVIAVEDALREFPDLGEVVLLTNSGEQERWAEHDAFDRIRRRVDVPVTLLEVDESGTVVDSEHSDPGPDETAEPVVQGGGRNMPAFSVRELAAILVAVIGTVILSILGAIAISGSNDPGSGLQFGDLVIAILAGGFFLINVWHVIGLLFFQSVGYRGAGSTFLAGLSLYGTLAALLVSALIMLI